MKVLIVCSKRSYAPYTNYIAPFIFEQVKSLEPYGVEFDYFLISGGGIKSYLKAVSGLRKKIREFRPDIIHAHYGLCGVVANIQRKIPVITTYHGSDINWNLRISGIAIKLSKWNIFVSDRLYSVAGRPAKSSVIPCGFNAEAFGYSDMDECKNALGWKKDKKYIIFSKEFTDKAKNYPLAKQAVELLDDPDIEFLQLYGYTREQIPLVLNASHLMLMTSLTEGSPQIVKECIACGCPIVSTDVGDVKEATEGVPNCFITTYEPEDVASKIKAALSVTHRDDSGKDIIRRKYGMEIISKRIFEVYENNSKI